MHQLESGAYLGRGFSKPGLGTRRLSSPWEPLEIQILGFCPRLVDSETQQVWFSEPPGFRRTLEVENHGVVGDC